jgi:hypothetical protein
MFRPFGFPLRHILACPVYALKITKICMRGKPKGLSMTGQNISEGKTKGYKQDRPKYV